MRQLFLASVWLALNAGCGDVTLEPLPFQVGIAADPASAATGEAIDFTVTAQGGDLLGIVTDFGDGSSTPYGTGGARTARVTFVHAYLAPGTFQVTATVTDARAGIKEATLQVTVQ